MRKSNGLKILFILLLPFLAQAIAHGAIQREGSVIPSQVTDDTAIHERLTEIRAPKTALNFDPGVNRLANLESDYTGEKLPLYRKSDRIKKPMKRISKTPYQVKKAK